MTMKLPPMDSPAFLDLPALAPPQGVTPNFTNPDNLRAPELAVLQLTLATLVVSMRLYTKRFIVKRILPEDWWLLAAWMYFAAFHVMVFKMEDLPLGVHQWDIKIRDAIWQGKLFHITTAIYCLVAAPLKIAIILQIRRIVLPHQYDSHSPFLRWTIDALIALNVLFHLALFIFQFSACRPLSAAWDIRLRGYCVPHRMIVHIASGSINTGSDLIIFVLPQPVIWGLRMERRRKWGLSAVFLVGGLACIASAVRLYYAILLFHATDTTYTTGLMGKWVEPELTFGFLAACLPVLPTFIKYMLRTSAGRKIRMLWTQSPMTEAGQSDTSVRQRDTFGRSDVDNRKSIVKTVEMDVEFADLDTTSEGWSRNNSVVEIRTGTGANIAHASGETPNDAGVRSPRLGQPSRWV